MKAGAHSSFSFLPYKLFFDAFFDENCWFFVFIKFGKNFSNTRKQVSTKFLEIVNIEKKYGSKRALRGVSLELEKGKVIGLLGVNGAGKTTLSSIVATVHPPTAGDIFFQGESIYRDIAQFRRQIGFCPQAPNLNNELTVQENLEAHGRYFGFDKQEIDLRINDLARDFQFTEFLEKKPSDLSGGYKQRVSISRSLFHSPKLVILDEPTSGLDPHVRNQLWEYVKQMRSGGITILLTTHYIEEAEQLSDYVCLLDKGLVRLVDTPDNLMRTFKKEKLEEVFIQLAKEKNE